MGGAVTAPGGAGQQKNKGSLMAPSLLCRFLERGGAFWGWEESVGSAELQDHTHEATLTSSWLPGCDEGQSLLLSALITLSVQPPSWS